MGKKSRLGRFVGFASAGRAGVASGEQTVRFPLARTGFGFLVLGPEGLVFPVAGEPGLGLGDRLGVTTPAGQVTFLKLNGLGEISPVSVPKGSAAQTHPTRTKPLTPQPPSLNLGRDHPGKDRPCRYQIVLFTLLGKNPRASCSLPFQNTEQPSLMLRASNSCCACDIVRIQHAYGRYWSRTKFVMERSLNPLHYQFQNGSLTVSHHGTQHASISRDSTTTVSTMIRCASLTNYRLQLIFHSFSRTKVTTLSAKTLRLAGLGLLTPLTHAFHSANFGQDDPTKKKPNKPRRDNHY